MENKTAIDWYFDKIKSHFEHDGDLLETATFTYAIAKQKEKQQIMEAVSFGDCRGRITTYLTDEQYYNETYGSKGSHDRVPDVRNMIEISDDEIDKQAEPIEQGIYRMFFKTGAKWYREQLKKKQ